MSTSREARRAVLDVALLRKAGAARIAARQRRRLAEFVGYTRAHSPFYRELYAALPPGVPPLGSLPVVTKPQIMAHFDEVVTDRGVTRAAVEAFLSDPGTVGTPFLGRYLVATSSGSTGHPGVFLQDELARVLAGALPRIRGSLTAWFGMRTALRFARAGRRYALVSAGGGPYGAVGALRWAARENPRQAGALRLVDVLDPIEEQVTALNEYQPAAVGGYPSAILLLAREQRAGRLRIAPMFIIFAGEGATAGARRYIETVFGCRAYEEYGSTECGVLAVQCREGWLHYNADWYVLEAVDEERRRVPPGTLSHTVLVTNLTNRVMPLIRYDQGDRVLFRPEPCPCGSAFPALHVVGRCGDLLELPARTGGGTVALAPLGLVAIIEEVPGVYRVQIVHHAGAELEIRLQVLPAADPHTVWSAVAARLRGYLDGQGVGPVTLRYSDAPPLRHPRSGKYAQVIADPAVT